MDKPSAAGSVRADVGRSLALPHRRPVAVGDAHCPASAGAATKTAAATIGVDHRLDRVAQVVATLKPRQRPAVGLAVGIVGRTGRVSVEGKERREPFDALDEIPALQHLAFRREIFGDEKPQSIGLVRHDELAPEIG
jgi:hypothetical protein